MPIDLRLTRSVQTVAMTLAVSMSACAMKQASLKPISDEYASASVFAYQPMNPATVWVADAPCLAKDDSRADITSPEFKDALLRDLDTETIRIALSKVNADASATIAVVGASVKNESYVLIVDYIKYFAHNKAIDTTPKAGQPALAATSKPYIGHVPIYEGIGVRIRAEYKALQGGLTISGLPALSIAANANQISGRLTVQTLGVTGKDITALMPIISDISVASIQSAVQAMAAIKAKLYDPSTIAYPKIVGFEVPSERLDAVPQITEKLYDLEETVHVRMSPNPNPPASNPKARYIWIAWEPPAEQLASPPKCN